MQKRGDTASTGEKKRRRSYHERRTEGGGKLVTLKGEEGKRLPRNKGRSNEESSPPKGKGKETFVSAHQGERKKRRGTRGGGGHRSP